MSVWRVAANGEGVLAGFDGGAARQEDPKPLNDLRGGLGDIGEGSFNGSTIDPFGLANEPGGFGIPIGAQINENDRYMHPLGGDHHEKIGTETSEKSFDPQK